MASQRWDQVERLFEQLTTMPQAERAAFIERECANDAELRTDIESLLAAHLVESGPLDVPPSVAGDLSQPLPDAETSHIGPYVLLSQIAEGGMGAVWLAERADGLMKRKVALKLPHWSWVRPDLAARMAREREILAGLEHPHIARLYDAGVDSLGRPYLAMEYVEGEPIDVYCRSRNLPVKACLELVSQVARAVAHAHSRLVVHRDLKPSNILVDAQGSVRLLDFGIAKLLDTDVTRETRLTQMVGRALTPEYASPEQVKGEAIGTATDVYSLAIVTYELLTGTKPYKLKRGSAAELEEAIASADPVPASEAAADGTRKRQLRGDLDAILNKALKKDPAERYASIDAFAQDVQRYVGDEPVRARPDSSLYRLGKFASRNRFALAAAGVIVIALVSATAVSLWQARVAQAQRNRAEALLARNEAVSEFVNLMLTEVASPDQPITLDALLERSESMIYSGVTPNPEHQATILALLSSYYESFGAPAKSETLLRKALDLSRNSADATLRTRLTCSYAYARSQLGDMDEAKATLQHIVDDPNTPADAAADCLQHRAFIAQNTNDAAAALDYAQRAQATLKEAERNDPILEADLIGDIGYAYQLGGKLPEAERYFAESLQKFAAIGRSEHPLTVTVRNNFGMAIQAAGDSRRALAMYDEAARIARKHAAGGALPAYLMSNRALVLADVGRYDEALIEYDRVIAAGEKGQNLQLKVNGLMGKVKVCIERQDFDRAERWLADAQAVMGNAVPPDSPTGMSMQLAQNRIAAGHGHFEEAEAGYSRIVEFWQSRHMAIGAMASALRSRAEVYLATGRLEEAQADAEGALSISRKMQAERPFSKDSGIVLTLLSRIHAQMGRIEDARREAGQSAQQLEQALGPDHPFTRRARELAAVPPASDATTPAPNTKF
jgi:eukaryotic-like serine/threonine-protein kinase